MDDLLAVEVLQARPQALGEPAVSFGGQRLARADHLQQRTHAGKKAQVSLGWLVRACTPETFMSILGAIGG